ncbi:MAG TPA: protoporphyrinogen oxidase [Propionibacteriaceae bacterium]|nr:protoporphyrinogen oxidase [Propionibacteriaceae bacterium]
MTSETTRAGLRVAIVGGGVTGLVAAWRIVGERPDAHVTLLEASGRLGGQVRAIDVDGVQVDVGAEAIHLGAPDAASLVRDLGLDTTVIAARRGQSLLLTRRGLRPLPAGVGPTGPTQVGPVLKSGILSVPGLLRAGLEPLTRRRHPGDLSVGDFIDRRFGREVTTTFVDPLLGNLHSGDVHRLSLHATAKQLVPVAASGDSLLVRALKKRVPPPRRPDAPAPLPMFASWPGGLGALVVALTSALEGRVTVRTGVRADAVVREGEAWRVETSEGPVAADAVVVAVGPEATARLLGPHSPTVATAMGGVDTASVATVVLAYEADAAGANEVLRDYNGLLLNSHQSGTLKAMTNMSRKWPLGHPDWHIVRISVGRAGLRTAVDLSDAEMIDAVTRELSDLIGLAARPVFARAVRWPATLPQLSVGHLERVAAAREELSRLGGLHLAGSASDGLGLTSTIASGTAVARAVAATGVPVG